MSYTSAAMRRSGRAIGRPESFVVSAVPFSSVEASALSELEGAGVGGKDSSG